MSQPSQENCQFVSASKTIFKKIYADNLPSAIENDSGTPSKKMRRDFRVKNIDVTTTRIFKNPTTGDADMKLIPWTDIWTSLKAAKCRGHGKMIDAFYDTLFQEATFDDKGAWSPRMRR